MTDVEPDSGRIGRAGALALVARRSGLAGGLGFRLEERDQELAALCELARKRGGGGFRAARWSALGVRDEPMADVPAGSRLAQGCGQGAAQPDAGAEASFSGHDDMDEHADRD
jgi:hypothetical protein